MNETRYNRQEFIPRESFIFRWVLSRGGGLNLREEWGYNQKVEKIGHYNQKNFLQSRMVISVNTVKSITKMYCHFFLQSSSTLYMKM